MRKTKFLQHWILISGIIISIIGIAHNTFAPSMYRAMRSDPLFTNKLAGSVYFFVLGGTAFLFAGLLTIYASTGIKTSEKWAKVVAISSGVFVSLGAMCAVLYADFGNPLIYAMGVCAISNIVILSAFSKTPKL